MLAILVALFISLLVLEWREVRGRAPHIRLRSHGCRRQSHQDEKTMDFLSPSLPPRLSSSSHRLDGRPAQPGPFKSGSESHTGGI